MHIILCVNRVILSLSVATWSTSQPVRPRLKKKYCFSALTTLFVLPCYCRELWGTIIYIYNLIQLWRYIRTTYINVYYRPHTFILRWIIHFKNTPPQQRQCLLKCASSRSTHMFNNNVIIVPTYILYYYLYNVYNMSYSCAHYQWDIISIIHFGAV